MVLGEALNQPHEHIQSEPTRVHKPNQIASCQLVPYHTEPIRDESPPLAREAGINSPTEEFEISKSEDAENPFLLLHKYRNLISPEAQQRIDRAIYRIKTDRDTTQMRVIYDELEKVIKLQTNLLHFQNYVEDVAANKNGSSFQQLLEQEPTILKESGYLQPLSDPPEMHIEARDDLLRILRTVLAESLRSASNRTLFLYGPPGTGKTLCARSILEELRAYYEKKNKPIHLVYVNAGQTRNPYYTLLAITQEMGVKAPSSGWQYTRLKQEFEKAKKTDPVIIAIDEADVILPKEREPLIYYLNRQPGVLLILISNHYADLAALPPRAKSTLQPFPINFQPYQADEIQAILQARIKHALQPHTLTPQALTRIAQITAHKEDLRYAFTLLHTAALTTQASGRKQIQTNDIDAVAATLNAEQ